MKIGIPASLIRFAYKFVDLEATSEVNQPEMRLYEYSFALSRLVRLQKGTLLDIGCTARMNLIPATMCQLGWRVFGIDTREFRYEHPKFKFIKGDARYLGMAGEFYDAVTAISTIEHIGLAGRYGIKKNEPEADREVVEAVYGSLKDSGIFVLTVPYTFDKGHVSNIERIYDIGQLYDLLEPFKIKEARDIAVGKERTMMITAVKEIK